MNWARYILKRLTAALPLLFILPLITFGLMHLIPGNYFDSLRMNPQISPEMIHQYEELYHLDKPVAVQYFFWLKNLFRGDLGYSFAYKQPVISILQSRVWNTLLLSGVSFLIAWLLAFFLGLRAAVHRGGFLDKTLNILAYAGLSVPNFLLCLLLLALASQVNFLPLGGMKSVFYEEMSRPAKIADVAWHMVIPVTVTALSSFSFLFRVARGQALEIAGKDFVVFLRTQRVPESRIIYKHIARNAVNPMVTLFGLELPALFSGVALVEIFTGWPGLGQVLLQAVRAQDLFLVLGNTIIVALLLIAGNLLADLALVMIDPRIRMVNP